MKIELYSDDYMISWKLGDGCDCFSRYRITVYISILHYSLQAERSISARISDHLELRHPVFFYTLLNNKC